MDKHLNHTQWCQLFAHEMNTMERARALRHICDCESCNQIYVAAGSLRSAFRAARASSGGITPYTAVAGADHRVIGQRIGSLTVKIEADDTGMHFCVDSLRTDGIAEKYALNPENADRTLADDEGLLRLALTEGTIEIHFEDGGSCFAILNDDENAWTELERHTTLALPQGTRSRLELLLFA